MSDPDPKIAELEARLQSLVRTQIDFQVEITAIRRELSKLREGSVPAQPFARIPPPELLKRDAAVPPKAEPPPVASQMPPTGAQDTSRTVPPQFGSTREEPKFATSPRPPESAFSNYVSSNTESARNDLEKFIGENLISKIGIVILVLGVGIGAKYAIDNGWISPLLRIVFGYVIGFGLLGFAVRLKAKYLNFSAVLLSGGMAIMYFVTYFAFAAYGLINQPTAFVLMAMFTAFTVASAIFYNRQVIAHIGLVGAYAVPFLLSDNSGNYLFLFAYMAIINLGVLAVSVKKEWGSIFYTSSIFTWLIFGVWFATKYAASEHFYLALAFLAFFFGVFYTTKIMHGLTQDKSRNAENLSCLIATTFIFYCFCFAISDLRADVFEYAVFFSYLGIISLSILLSSYRFYGRVLVYLSYPFTWLIFGAWMLFKYRADEHFLLAAVFAGVFFAIYYGATLIYRLVTDEIEMFEVSALVLTNSFIFYGFGYAIMDSRESFRSYEGVFTVAHAGFHSLVAQTVNKVKTSAIDVIQVLAVLILTFATIAIPVQIDGNFVTLIWSVEAAILFWFGRERNIPLFEYFSLPIMVLASGSLLLDWLAAYGERTMYVSEFNRQPLANGDFITALVFVAAFAFIYVINRDERQEPAIGTAFVRPLGYAVVCVGLFVLYNTFRVEIDNYFHIRAIVSIDVSADAPLNVDRALGRFNVLWQLDYTMFFLTAMAAVNLRKVRSTILAAAGAGLSVFSLVLFVTVGMQLLHELRLAYMAGDAGVMNVVIRYISYGFVAALLFALFQYRADELSDRWMPIAMRRLAFDAIFYSTVLISASCELVNLMGQFHIPDALKLGLSVLWGVYALLLIVLGIAWNKRHLRIAAIGLLGITLAKLFFYDIADLPTIPKTILFISLGLLMLIVSFLYNKYKGLIFKSGTAETDQDANLL